MAEVMSPLAQLPALQQARSPKGSEQAAPTLPLSIGADASSSRPSHRNEVFSPVNQNGSFEFDRVLKSGEVSKRSRKTKQWKRFFFVLRSNLLSVYKNSSEEKLHKQINLSELTAVLHLKDPKGRRNHMFGLFSPPRNYHLQVESDAEATAWVELIRREARIDEEEETMVFGSPVAELGPCTEGLERAIRSSDERWDRERLASSSPEPENTRPLAAKNGVRIPGIRTLASQELEHSGNEHASYSDFSDSAPKKLRGNYTVVQPNSILNALATNNNNAAATSSSFPKRPIIRRSASQLSGSHLDDEERVIWHGYLHALKSKGGVRQWKRLWVVLRPKNAAFYKNEEEYSAQLIIPMSSVISAVEIDPISRSKAHCFQIIAEEKSYRFCAYSEDALARCLGALKSQLAKKKEKDYARTGRIVE